MVDVVKVICKKLDATCSFEIQPMKRIMLMLENGSTDGVLSLVKNPDRDAFSTLSITFIKSNLSIHAVSGTFNKTKKIQDLNNSLIGATASSSAAKLAEDLKAHVPGVKIEYEVGLPNVIRKLSAGRYGPRGLGIANEDVAESFMKKEGIKNVVPIFVAEEGSFGVSFSKKKVDPKFVAKFNMTLFKMKKSGELKKILAPYGLKLDPKTLQ